MKIRIIYGLCFSLLTAGFMPALANPTLKVYQNPAQGNPQTHKVAPKETLYGIARQYGVTVNELMALNPEAKNGLQIGQVLKIPGTTATAAAPVKPEPKPEPKSKAAEPTVTAAAPAKPETAPQTSRTFTVDAAGNKIHKVAPKQTLYSVAIMHGVTMADIRKWNDLKVDALKVDQKLIVGVNEQSRPTAQYIPEKDDALDISKTATASAAKKPEPKIDAKPAPTTQPVAKTETPKEATDESDDDRMENKTVVVANKVIETGMAEVISSAGDNNKFLALHKTAPVGSILQVKNIMNGQNVYVRVIGKLPETGANDKVIIRLSKRACQRLAAIDNRFRVEVAYMP